MPEPITEVWRVSGGMAAANGLYDREDVAQAQHALNQSAGFKSAALERLPLATPEMVADKARLVQLERVFADLQEGMRSLQRTLDTHDAITLSDYLAGTDVNNLKQRITLSHGDDVYHDSESVHELLLREAASFRVSDPVIALHDAKLTDEEYKARVEEIQREADRWLNAAIDAARAAGGAHGP